MLQGVQVKAKKAQSGVAEVLDAECTMGSDVVACTGAGTTRTDATRGTRGLRRNYANLAACGM